MLEDTFVPLALSEKLDLRNVPRRVYSAELRQLFLAQ